MSAGAGIAGWARRFRSRAFPAAPPEIADALAFAQYVSIDRQVPLLHFIAILNILLVIAISMHDRLSPWSYAWLPAMMLYSLLRISNWRAKSLARPNRAMRNLMLASATRTTLVLLTLFATWGSVTLWIGLYSSPLAIPIAMMFGGICVAHSLVAIRSACIGGTIISVFPMATVLLLKDDLGMQLLGGVMAITGLLKLHVNNSLYQALLRAIYLEQQNKELANTDPLTGLRNRRAMMAELHSALAQPGGLGVAIMDLDGFKSVNDRYGHDVGDQLLIQVSARLQQALVQGDSAGRLGGDEFLILCRDIDSHDALDVRIAAILSALAGQFSVNGVVLPVGASVGYTMRGDAAQSERDLLIAADAALYGVKNEARQRQHHDWRAAKAA